MLYALAYQADYLYLSLIGRMVSGIGFTIFMYCKRYCTDSRIVGIRRRTTLASWLVMGQGIGMSLGPFAGGLLYKVGFKNSIFNGYTAPGWIMTAVWCIFWACVYLWYEDPRDNDSLSAPEAEDNEIPMVTFGPSDTDSKVELDTAQSSSISRQHSSSGSRPTPTVSRPTEENPLTLRNMSKAQWGVVICMCWFAMTCFFILGAWEANLPVLGADYSQFHWSPFAAGNFIALGGVTTFPFLIFNLLFARKIQDRHILAFGTTVGAIALFTFLGLVKTGKLNYGGAFFCWWAVALGFNVATTYVHFRVEYGIHFLTFNDSVTVSLLSKQLPSSWNGRTSLAIQYSNYAGRVGGAIWGGSGIAVGMPNYISLEIGLIGIGAVMFTSLWRDLKAKTG